MSTATLTATIGIAENRRRGQVDNRFAYMGLGFAYIFGHGAAAVSRGSDPLLDLPGWLPMTLLVGGLAAGTVAVTVAATRAQRDATGPDVVTGQLLGLSWVTAFVALFLAITGLANFTDMPELQTLLWPTGSGLVVGLLYLGEGVARRNVLHYVLGGWVALVSAGALLLSDPGPYWVLAGAGGGAYLIAVFLEYRRLTKA